MNLANWSCHQSLILTVFFSLPIARYTSLLFSNWYYLFFYINITYEKSFGLYITPSPLSHSPLPFSYYKLCFLLEYRWLCSCIGHSCVVLIHFEAFIHLLTSLFPFNNNGPQIHLCDIPYCHVMFEYICLAQFFLRLHRHYIIMKSDPFFFLPREKALPSIGLDNVLVWPLRSTSNLAHYLVAPLWIFVFSIVFLGI